MSEDFEFEDGEQINKKAPDAAQFDAFADEEVDASSPAPVGPHPSSKKMTPVQIKPQAGFDAFADIGEDDPDADSATDAEIKPGQGKDLWTCMHCAAKNKPNRDSCRKCGKTADDEVIIPLFSRPPVKFGAMGGVAILFLIIIMMATSVDVSLHKAGADFIGSAYNNNGSQVAGSGRIFKVVAGEKTIDVTIVFGYESRDDKTFRKMRYSAKHNEVTRGGMGAQKFIVLRIVNDDKSAPAFVKGVYAAFTGRYGSVDDPATDTERHNYTLNASDISWDFQ